MERIASCSMAPSAVLLNANYLHQRQCNPILTFPTKPKSDLSLSPFGAYKPLPITYIRTRSRAHVGDDPHRDGGNEEDDEAELIDRALGMEGGIPGSAHELVNRVSSRAYQMRRQLNNTIDSSSYDVLESNPWRENPKSVYVLTQKENQLCTMKTRRTRSEVEKELGLLFSTGRKHKSEFGEKPKHLISGTTFHMLVEDIREGILVFEDRHDAARYCDLLQGSQGCEGIAEVDSSSVFDICHKMRALAVIFRRGGSLPLPETLRLHLKARQRSLEDQ